MLYANNLWTKFWLKVVKVILISLFIFKDPFLFLFLHKDLCYGVNINNYSITCNCICRDCYKNMGKERREILRNMCQSKSVFK